MLSFNLPRILARHVFILKISILAIDFPCFLSSQTISNRKNRKRNTNPFWILPSPVVKLQLWPPTDENISRSFCNIENVCRSAHCVALVLNPVESCTLIKISLRTAQWRHWFETHSSATARETHATEKLKFRSFFSELVKWKLFVMKTITSFGIIFCNGNYKNYPLTISLFSHGDLMTSFLLVRSLGNVFLSSFLLSLASVLYYDQKSALPPLVCLYLLLCVVD